MLQNTKKDMHFNGLEVSQIERLKELLSDRYRACTGGDKGALRLYVCSDASLAQYVRRGDHYEYSQLPDDQYRVDDDAD